MRSKGLFQPLVLAGILSTGFTVVWGIVGIWAVQVGEHVVGPERAGEHLFFLPDGTPRVLHPVGQHDRQYRDLEGNPVPPPKNETSDALHGTPLPVALSDRATTGEIPWDQRIRFFRDSGVPATYWYFVSDGRPDGTGYFVGYDSKSKACVGYLGKAGFRAEPLSPEEEIPFAGATRLRDDSGVICMQWESRPTAYSEGDLSWRASHGEIFLWDVYVLGRDGKLYHANLENRTLHVALDEPRLRSAALSSDHVRKRNYILAARTDDSVLMLDERDQVLGRYPIPEALRGQAFSFAETGAEAVMYWHSPSDSLATQIEYRIYWVTPQGQYREARASLARDGGPWTLPVLSGVVLPSPLLLAGSVGIFRPRELLAGGLAWTYPEALGRALTEFRPALIIAHLLAASFAILCYRRQVRYGVSGPERVVWPLFVLALGLPGWVGYRFGRSWPALESCSVCGADVPRDRADCAHCEAEFPQPALKGTEVFA
jgi:hypothetical protein